MATVFHRVGKPILMLALLAAATVMLSACGSGSESSSTTDGAAELAHQRELAQARRQGAHAARQATRIAALEREVHAVQKDARKTPSQSPPSAEPEPTPAPSTEIVTGDWPGGSGYTAILASVSSEGEARSIQTEATGKGLDAGVLFSSDYSSLRPGYWVVFSGVFQDSEGAEGRAGHAHELGYSDAYPRFVSP
jgi:hypothetical protein